MKKTTATETTATATATETTALTYATATEKAIIDSNSELFAKFSTEALRSSTVSLFKLAQVNGSISKAFCVAYASIRSSFATDKLAVETFKNFDGFLEKLSKLNPNAPKRSTANQYAQIGERFIDPVTGLSIFAKDGKDFSTTALRDLLTLDDTLIQNCLDDGRLSLDSSVSTIRKLVKSFKEAPETTATDTTATETETTATAPETTATAPETTATDNTSFTLELNAFLQNSFTVTMEGIEHETDGLGIFKDFLVFLKVGTEIDIKIKRNA